LAAALKTRSTQVIRLPLCGKTDKLRGAVAGRLWGFVRLRPSVRWTFYDLVSGDDPTDRK